MSRKFEIGEIALVESWTGTGYVDCEILGFEREEDYVIFVPTYPNHNRADRGWKCLARLLKKKKPPEEAVSWERVRELTNWNPTEELEDASTKKH